MFEGDVWTWTLPVSGEFLIDVQPLRADAIANDYALGLACTAGCDLPFTRYPLLFLHGAMGTDNYLGILDYWYGVPYSNDMDWVGEPGFEALSALVAAGRTEELQQLLGARRAKYFAPEEAYWDVALLESRLAELGANTLVIQGDPNAEGFYTKAGGAGLSHGRKAGAESGNCEVLGQVAEPLGREWIGESSRRSPS